MLRASLYVYVFPASLSLPPSALQTTQPPKVLFPPERHDTVMEITPGKGPRAAPSFLLLSLKC